MTLAALLHDRGGGGDRLARLLLRRRLARHVRRLERGRPPREAQPRASDGAAFGGAAGFGVVPDDLPPEVTARVLGPRLLETCCFWPRWAADLAKAEDEMLHLTCDGLEITDGMTVLDVGAGWAGVACWIAERYPSCRVTAIIASAARRDVVDERAGPLPGGVEIVGGLSAVAERTFDRVVAIESLPGDCDVGAALDGLARHLEPAGRALVQLACHRTVSQRPWTGSDLWVHEPRLRDAVIPASDRLMAARSRLTVLHRRELSGEHYERTARAWLQRLDEHRQEVLAALTDPEAGESARSVFRSWRLALLATAEMFGFFRGQEWWISQYLLAHRREGAARRTETPGRTRPDDAAPS